MMPSSLLSRSLATVARWSRVENDHETKKMRPKPTIENTAIRKTCLQNGLHLLDAQVRHLGTDINYVVLGNLYDHLKDKVDFYFDCPVETLRVLEEG